MPDKVDELVKKFRETADQLEKVDKNDSDAVNNVMRLNTIVCCNTCQQASTFCVPDNTPNKCKGGCTVTSVVW